MNGIGQTIPQAIMWTLALSALLLFLQRRRRRKANY
jgi:MYXO-CTERM domain-containing protein